MILESLSTRFGATDKVFPACEKHWNKRWLTLNFAQNEMETYKNVFFESEILFL